MIADRVVSFWYQGSAYTIRVHLETTTNVEKTLEYRFASGTSGVDGSGNVTIYLGTGYGSSTWRRFERNIEQDFEQYSTSYSWLKTHGIRFRPGPDAYVNNGDRNHFSSKNQLTSHVEMAIFSPMPAPSTTSASRIP